MTQEEEGLNVLIVDDHSLFREFVRNTLRDSKVANVKIATIDTAINGAQAINLIQKARKEGRSYDIVFLDWNMPEISGLEVLGFFRAQPEYADIAFVMLTARSEQRDVMKGIASGATSYIAKPVSAAVLGRRLIEIHQWITGRSGRATS